ncbi:helix-turn-helix domain-containing protein [Methyloradius palustris]|uniref:HTH cro/C1-type domain-containing protein n=1 Tax=Methyloradius palustris TaxID=2778876 RepID=A0A8D5G619_9PROT|nr:helix-turn-helix transcriptional regulator [Methyloradius palustris]BCM23827.1 hypothetical protein ZMTM_00860 [Methyloradius palustris]
MSDDKKHTENTNGYVPPEDTIGVRIKARRNELALNVEELARLTQQYDYGDEKKGISASMLRRYEYEDGSKPGTREIRLLCDALDVSADWLIRGIDPNLNQETSNLSVAAESFINAVKLIIQEKNDPFSNMGKTQIDWKNIERSEKIEKAKNPNK